MGLLLKQIFNLFKLLNSDKGTNQIAAGVACGLILGFSPALSLQALIVVICLFFFRIQIGAATLSAFFFAFIAYLIDPIAHTVGAAVLEIEGLRPLFTTMYNMPIVPFTKFYNSIVMGSGIITIVLAPFIFVLSKKLINKYRETVVQRFQNTKYWKLFKATTFYQWYQKYDSLYG